MQGTALLSTVAGAARAEGVIVGRCPFRRASSRYVGVWAGLSSLSPPSPLLHPFPCSSFSSLSLIRADDAQLHPGHGRGDEADEFVHGDQ